VFWDDGGRRGTTAEIWRAMQQRQMQRRPRLPPRPSKREKGQDEKKWKKCGEQERDLGWPDVPTVRYSPMRVCGTYVDVRLYLLILFLFLVFCFSHFPIADGRSGGAMLR